MIQAPAGEPRGLALLLTDASADASLLPGVAVAAAALAAAAYGSPLIPTAYSSRALSLLPRAAAVAAPAAWWALQPSEALAEAAVVGGSYGVVEAFDEVRVVGLRKQGGTGINRPPRGLTTTHHTWRPGASCYMPAHMVGFVLKGNRTLAESYTAVS